MTERVEDLLLNTMKEETELDILFPTEISDSAIDMITGFNEETMEYDFEEDVSPLFPQP